MPKTNLIKSNSEKGVHLSQHFNLYKKAGVKNVPAKTLEEFVQNQFGPQMEEFTKVVVALLEADNVKIITPQHLLKAYELVTGNKALYNKRVWTRRKK